MQLDSTRKHILTEINDVGFKKCCITTVETTDFSNIETPISATEKVVGVGKTLRECLLEQEAAAEGSILKLLTGIENHQNVIIQI